MRTCSACGADATEAGAAFCFACGHALAPESGCASCGRELRPDARFCPFCGTTREPGAADQTSTTAHPGGSGSARKIASVLFGDLVGFTTISESRDAEEVRELLSAYFEECRAIVARYGGELEKFIGDAVMAVWGLPVTREDDAERAVRAGLELVEAVQALGDRIAVPGLNMRVGITTAEVAVNLGATGQGMVAGDPVNTAARIQSTAEPGQVWVDETTRHISSSAIAFEDAGSHAMKGKAEPVPLWKVRTVVGGIRGGRRDDAPEAALVGRDAELRLVKEVFHRVEQGHRPGMLVIDSEAGIGKSRLGWEFEKYVDGFQASVLWHRGRCLSYGEGVAYYALAEAVRGRLAVLAGDDTAPDGRDVLSRALEACVPDRVERDWLQPRLAALLGLQAGGAFEREDLYAAWTAFFRHVSQDGDELRPVVLVVDDAQYADQGLLAFLEHLLASADYPIFVLALARPELLAERPTLAANRRVTVVHLEPLDEQDMSRLLDSLVPGMPAPILDALVTRAEGVPLYAIETVRSMVDQNLVAERDGRYVLTDPAGLDLSALTAPASLQALIAARLDTLPADERRVVDRASVLGLVFTQTGIAALCSDVADLDGALAGLARREVIRRETDRLSADFGSLRFVQGAFRQVAYGTLSRRDRKAAHLEVAGVLEAELASPDGAGAELAPIIAQHYLDAIDAVPADPDVPDLTRAASDHLERAADRAAGLGASREAAAHLLMALSRCDAERRRGIQSRLAHQLRLTGDLDSAIEHATAAVKAFEADGDVLAAATVAEDLAQCYSRGGDDPQAEALAREHLARLPDTPEALRARLGLVTVLAAVTLNSNRVEELMEHGAESARLAELIDEPRLIADAWITYALGAGGVGMPRLATAIYQRAAEIAAESRATWVQGIALMNWSGVLVLEDLPEGLRVGEQAIVVSRRSGDRFYVAHATAAMAFMQLCAGDWSETTQLLANEELVQFVDHERRILSDWMGVARGEPAELLEEPEPEEPSRGALFARGISDYRTAPGEGTLARVVDETRTAVELTYLHDGWARWLIASDLAVQAADRGAASALLDLVVGDAIPYPPSVRAQIVRTRALLGADGSQTDEQIDAWYAEGLQATRRWGSPMFEARISGEYGRWLRRQGRTDEAADQLQRARDFYERVGAGAWIESLDQD